MVVSTAIWRKGRDEFSGSPVSDRWWHAGVADLVSFDPQATSAERSIQFLAVPAAQPAAVDAPQSFGQLVPVVVAGLGLADDRLGLCTTLLAKPILEEAVSSKSLHYFRCSSWALPRCCRPPKWMCLKLKESKRVRTL